MVIDAFGNDWTKSLGQRIEIPKSQPLFRWSRSRPVASNQLGYVVMTSDGFIDDDMESSKITPGDLMKPRKTKNLEAGSLVFVAQPVQNIMATTDLAILYIIYDTLEREYMPFTALIKDFALPWDSSWTSRYRHAYPGAIFRCDLRFCSEGKVTAATAVSVLELDRQEARIEGRDVTVRLREYRFSILVVSTYQGSSKLRENVAIVQSDLPLPWLGINHGPLTREAWKWSGLLPCRSATAAALVIGLVYFAIKEWHQGWRRTLDEIDRAVRVELRDSMDDEAWDRLMFDSSFKLSKVYFTALQVLRIASEWVDESMKDMAHVCEDGKVELIDVCGIEPGDKNDVLRNFDKLAEIMETEGKRLLWRIEKKTEEIKSLRDGLFSATSLRESTKAIALNQAIYVFTIVTVIYTPIGFLAAFWALPFLNGPDDDNPTGPPRGFIATFITVPLTTYVICITLAWYSATKPNVPSMRERLLGST